MESYLALAFPGHRLPAEFAAADPRQDGGEPAVPGRPAALPARPRAVIAEEAGGWGLARGRARLPQELPESVRS